MLALLRTGVFLSFQVSIFKLGHIVDSYLGEVYL